MFPGDEEREFGWDCGGQAPRIPGCGEVGQPLKGQGLRGNWEVVLLCEKHTQVTFGLNFSFNVPLSVTQFKPTSPVLVKAFCLAYSSWYDLLANKSRKSGLILDIEPPSVWQGSLSETSPVAKEMAQNRILPQFIRKTAGNFSLPSSTRTRQEFPKSKGTERGQGNYRAKAQHPHQPLCTREEGTCCALNTNCLPTSTDMCDT